MAVRSKRLFGPTVVGTTSTALYTCPAGETALLKHLSIVNNAGVTSNMEIRLNGVNGGSNIVRTNVAGTGDEQLTPAFIVLHPGDTLSAITTLASSVVTGFGAELEGVAD